MIILFFVIFILGVVGYGYFFNMNLSDAIYNTSITMSNLGISAHEKTNGEKIFTAMYSIISGVFFLSLMSALVAYIFAEFMEK